MKPSLIVPGPALVTKQSLARVLSALIRQDYVVQAPGPIDRRQRLLTLTEKGAALELRLFEQQRVRLEAAYTAAGAQAADGFSMVLRGIMDQEARAYLETAADGA